MITTVNDSDSKDKELCGFSQGPHLHDVHALSEQDIGNRLLAAAQLCDTEGVRFTPLRRRIYQLILQSEQPLGAYDLIESLKECREQEQGEHYKMVAPPTIYRTLDFLLQLGFIHQLNSMNAFVPCCHPRNEHNAVFLICNVCKRVQELSGLPVQKIVDFVKEGVGFKVEQSIMELKGICNACQLQISNS